MSIFSCSLSFLFLFFPFHLLKKFSSPNGVELEKLQLFRIFPIPLQNPFDPPGLLPFNKGSL
ncbi:hypothetical protein COS78_02150 [Candidatus Shapirobacteria bacterium CG06_land_8_20_14_3_00_40_12]|uniref:Uncharacterized protein n=1 Tax=Candidatus Shapirobacteria bacterium CG06_land_8_20_14_3_00_40_12 TaxID=1974881 RepID=A0A2M7AS85_9BACT|nr:MAG: hypothetical protein COS78_02150 [Candidatus Shapirobacteria bacterium CG06_land_8_20_14_3_00_40_12]